MWFYVKTSKREYCVRDYSKVVWERGERVLEISPVTR